MAKKNYAYINKDMLIWARGETPFATPADVETQQKGIKAEKLEMWESGEDLPSITEAKKLASLYKVPFAAFFLSAPPEKAPKNYADRRTYGGDCLQRNQLRIVERNRKNHTKSQNNVGLYWRTGRI